MNSLDAAQLSSRGELLRRALDLRAMLKMGIDIGLDEICADELHAMFIIDQEQNRFEEERSRQKP